MRQARGSGDAAALGLSLRTVLHRNFGGQLRGNERGKERIWEQQPETTRPELQAPKKQRKDSMCIAPATKAYKAPGARTATAFVQPPTPTFAVVAPSQDLMRSSAANAEEAPAANERYMARGVSASKEDVHAAIANVDKGLFPKAFCKVVPDLLTGDGLGGRV